MTEKYGYDFDDRTDPTAYPHFDPHTEWVNYGDVSPKKHGGMWLRWDPEYDWWKAVWTEPMSDLSPSYSGVEWQAVGVATVYPKDVWEDGDPTQGYTPLAERTIEALSGNTPPADSPPLMSNVSRLIVDVARHKCREDYEEKELSKYDGYTGLIRTYGVEPDA